MPFNTFQSDIIFQDHFLHVFGAEFYPSVLQCFPKMARKVEKDCLKKHFRKGQETSLKHLEEDDEPNPLVENVIDLLVLCRV